MKFGLKSMALVIACIAAICVLPAVADTQSVNAQVTEVVTVTAPAAIDTWALDPSSATQPQTISGGNVNIKSNSLQKLTASASNNGLFTDGTNTIASSPLNIISGALSGALSGVVDLESSTRRGNRNVAITYSQSTTYSDPASAGYYITVTFTAAST